MVQNGKVKIYLADIRPLFDETMQKKALAQLDEVRAAVSFYTGWETGIFEPFPFGRLCGVRFF